jgi:hypothetical protein
MRDHRNPRPKVPKPTPTDNPPRRLTKAAIVAVEDALDELRAMLAKTGALAFAIDDLFQRIIWDDRRDPRDEDERREHLALLIDATKETVGAAVGVGDEIASEMFRLRVRPRGAQP